MAIYKDKSVSIEERIDDLMSKMTLEEKIGQMLQLPAKQGIVEENYVDKIYQWHIGSFLHCTGSLAEEIQHMAEKSRLGIPVLFGIDAIHGHCFEEGATVFPTQLSLSCSWNPDIVHDMAKITAREVRATGLHWTFSPVLCIGRDTRWGRINETFGEDQVLIGELATAAVKGYQGESLSDPESVLACAKHFAAYGESIGGRDSYESEVTRRKMQALFLPPFRKAVREGKTRTLMAGYQAIGGIPASANSWLLDEVPRKQWEFEGIIITDWNNVGALKARQMVAPTYKDAARQAIEAGHDMIMSTESFFDSACELVREGAVSESRIDESVYRILKVKFEMGLFDENRYTRPDAVDVIGCEKHWECSLEASRQSVTLLQNNGVLPLKNMEGKKIFLTGPNGDDIIAQLGDWSFGSMQAGAVNENFHQDDTVTLRQALEDEKVRSAHGYSFSYEKGADTVDNDFDRIQSAVEYAEKADVIIACVGDTLSQHGEGHDRSDLSLSGKQQQLLEELKKTGKKLIVVFMASKPLAIPWVKENADALVCAFNPGAKGGVALKELIFGELNPSGKLTISFPHSAGQLPVHYNRYGGWHCDNGDSFERYIDLPQEPVYSFGEGMGYSPFQYSDLKIQDGDIDAGKAWEVSVKVKNCGEMAGTEVVQLYLNDLVSTVTTPVMELKKFRRVHLEPGERADLSFQLFPEDLHVVYEDLRRVVEPGAFEVYVGGSSKREQCLKDAFSVPGDGPYELA